MTDWRDRAGLYIVAFGDNARQCFIRAAQLFRKHCPGVAVAVASDRPVGPEDVFVQAEDRDIGARWAKLSAYDLTPESWQFICYMDADTECRGDPSFLFEALLAGWEMTICRHWGPHTTARFRNADNEQEFKQSVHEIGTRDVLTLQGGVWAFRRTGAVKAFFGAWQQEWLRWGKRDQFAMLRALYRHPVKLWVLPNVWNCRNRGGGKEVIHHYHATARRYAHQDWKSVKRFDDPEAWKIVEEGAGHG